MRKFLMFLLLIPSLAVADYNAKVYKPDADSLVVASGGALTVASGGTATIDGTLAIGSGGAVTRTVTKVIPAADGRVGATAGWTNAGNTGAALLPASQSASTFVVPVHGLKIGDTVTAFKVVAQIESAENTATLDADLRKLTNAAGDPTDASLGTITQVSVTADTAVAASKTLSAAETLASGEVLYVLLAGTTAANTDIQLLAIELTVTEN